MFEDQTIRDQDKTKTTCAKTKTSKSGLESNIPENFYKEYTRSINWKREWNEVYNMQSLDTGQLKNINNYNHTQLQPAAIVCCWSCSRPYFETEIKTSK